MPQGGGGVCGVVNLVLLTSDQHPSKALTYNLHYLTISIVFPANPKPCLESVQVDSILI